MLEDIAVLTGGNVVSEELGTKLENVTIGMLGRDKKVTSDKENTTIIDGVGTKADIDGRSEEHPYELQAQMRPSYAVFCLKKKTKPHDVTHHGKNEYDV